MIYVGTFTFRLILQKQIVQWVILRRKLTPCPQNVKEIAYKGLVEYASVWDPYCKTSTANLEKSAKPVGKICHRKIMTKIQAVWPKF